MRNPNIQPNRETLSPVNKGASNGQGYDYLTDFANFSLLVWAAAPDLNLSNLAPPKTHVVSTGGGVD